MIIKCADSNFKLQTIQSLILRIDNLKFDQLNSYLEDDFKKLYLCFIEDIKEPIAFICLTLENDQAEIDYLAIDEKYQGKSIMFEFLNKIESILLNNNVSKIFLEVRSKNERALNLYHRLNYKEYRIRKDYYINAKDDAICLEKVLK